MDLVTLSDMPIIFREAIDELNDMSLNDRQTRHLVSDYLTEKLREINATLAAEEATRPAPASAPASTSAK